MSNLENFDEGEPHDPAIDRTADFARVLANIALLDPSELEALVFAVKRKTDGGFASFVGASRVVMETHRILGDQIVARMNSAKDARDAIAKAARK